MSFGETSTWYQRFCSLASVPSNFIPIIFHFLWWVWWVFFLILLLWRVNQLWTVLLCGQRGLLQNLSGAKIQDSCLPLQACCFHQSKHNSPQILHPSVFPSGPANPKDVVEIIWDFWLQVVLYFFLPGLLTAVTRMCALQKRYFCSNVLCFYFCVRFSMNESLPHLCRNMCNLSIISGFLEVFSMGRSAFSISPLSSRHFT